MLGKTTEYAIRALVYIFIQNQEGKDQDLKKSQKRLIPLNNLQLRFYRI